MSLLGCCLRMWSPQTSPRGPSWCMMLLRWSLSRRFWERRCPGQWGVCSLGLMFFNWNLGFPSTCHWFVFLIYICSLSKRDLKSYDIYSLCIYKKTNLSVYTIYTNISLGDHEPNTQAHHVQIRWSQTLSVSWTPSTTKWLRSMTCWRQLVARKTHHPWSVTTWNSSDWCFSPWNFKDLQSFKFKRILPIHEKFMYAGFGCVEFT